VSQTSPGWQTGQVENPTFEDNLLEEERFDEDSLRNPCAVHGCDLRFPGALLGFSPEQQGWWQAGVDPDRIDAVLQRCRESQLDDPLQAHQGGSSFLQTPNDGQGHPGADERQPDGQSHNPLRPGDRAAQVAPRSAPPEARGPAEI
jgi:hypothetical protein